MYIRTQRALAVGVSEYNSYQSVKRLDEYYNELIKNIKKEGGDNSE